MEPARPGQLCYTIQHLRYITCIHMLHCAHVLCQHTCAMPALVREHQHIRYLHTPLNMLSWPTNSSSFIHYVRTVYYVPWLVSIRSHTSPGSQPLGFRGVACCPGTIPYLYHSHHTDTLDTILVLTHKCKHVYLKGTINV